MQDTKATRGQYGLGIFPTGGNVLIWGADTQAINTTCGRAWGHGGNLPDYLDLPISSPDGSRQAVLLVNADPVLMSQTQLEQVYNVLSHRVRVTQRNWYDASYDASGQHTASRVARTSFSPYPSSCSRGS
jgi:hypothetical protein